MSPPTTLIYGGSGKVAQHLIRHLLSLPLPHKIHPIVRSASQTPALAALGAHPIVQSIETSSAEAMAATMRATRATAIIWSAGAGGGDPARTRAVDFEGAVRCMDAAALAGVKRFVMVSAVDVRDREGGAEPEWYDEGDRERSAGMWAKIGPYMEAKLAADRSLVGENGRRRLEWTIVRPGGLSEEKGTGRVSAGKVHIQARIPREDVAAVVVECLGNEGTVGLAFDVVGGETGVREAVGKVVEGREDTFEGRY